MMLFAVDPPFLTVSDKWLLISVGYQEMRQTDNNYESIMDYLSLSVFLLTLDYMYEDSNRSLHGPSLESD